MGTRLQVRQPPEPSASSATPATPAATPVPGAGAVQVVGLAASGPNPASGPSLLESANLIGKSIGSYTVTHLLGEGGMGRVFLGEHALIGRKAAIKVLNPDIATDPEVVSRFFTEARAVNDIRHPNIVEVTDFGQFGGLYCIVMEYLEGETLAQRLARVGTIDELASIRIMKQCASALGAAHDRGLVHRDVKPENIFLRAHPDYPDFVKVLDFGIAKLLGTGGELGHHTRTGLVMGTPTYMSPEQCLGEAKLDVRSDIYSLGVVLYQMVTGQPPFTGDTLGRLIVCHVSEAPVPPVIANNALSRTMSDIILRMLQKSPADRFQTARELREAIERLAGGAGNNSGPVRVGAVNSPRIGAALANAEKPTSALRVPPRAAGNGVPMAVASQPTSGRAVVPQRTPSAPAAAPTPPDLGVRLAAIMTDRLQSGRVELPDLPGPTIRCIDLASQGRLGFAEAANIIMDVPSLRSRVMRLANSPEFPSRMPATTLEQAIARLGTQGLYGALIEFAAHDALQGRAVRVKELMRRSWPHALGTAVMATTLCQLLKQTQQVTNAYQAGLLHDVGRPVCAAMVMDIEHQMQRAGNRSPLPQAAFEVAIESCVELAGAAVARHWDLPGAVSQAIAASGRWDEHEGKSLGNILRLSCALTSRTGLTTASTDGATADRIANEGSAVVGLDEASLRRLCQGFKERITVLAGVRG